MPLFDISCQLTLLQTATVEASDANEATLRYLQGKYRGEQLEVLGEPLVVSVSELDAEPVFAKRQNFVSWFKSLRYLRRSA